MANSESGTWARYFSGISRFLESAERQNGTANATFCEYVLERLELCIDTCSHLRDHMVTGGSSRDEEIREDYKSNLDGLVDCLRCKWLEYEDIGWRDSNIGIKLKEVFKEEDAHDLK